MTERTPDGFADTPGPDATPEQDADVRSLLAFLRDEPVEMPPEVERRLYAVLAEERRSAAAVSGAPTAASGDDGEQGAGAWTAPVTVLPARSTSARRGPSMRVFQVVGGLAAAALVVVGAVNVLGGIGSTGSSTSTSTGAASSSAGSVAGAAPEAAGSTVVTASGTAYAKSTLATQVLALTAVARTPAKLATADAATPAPSASSAALGTGSTVGATTSGSTAYRSAMQSLQAPGAAAACVNALTDGETSSALAIDAGTFAGKPALVVVVPTQGDPSTLDVFVVSLDCSPSFVEFERVPAS